MRQDAILGRWRLAPSFLVRTARRRRLAFIAALAPGVLVAALGAQVRQDPAWLAGGLVGALIVVLARRLSEPRFQLWEQLADDPLEEHRS